MTHPLFGLRDPRTLAAPADRVGAIGHPGYGRDEELFLRVTPELKALAVERARVLGIKLNDYANNLLAADLLGPLPTLTPEQLAEAKTLTPAEAVAHIDPTLRGDQSREELVSHFAGLAEQEPLTLERLEEEEDKVIERLYQRQLDQAQERATPKEGDALSGFIKGKVNQMRYAEEVKLAREKKQREDRARARRREQRRLLLSVAALMVAPQLRREGDPRLQRQYEDRSHWSTMGGYSRRDVKEADLLAPKDTS